MTIAPTITPLPQQAASIRTRKAQNSAHAARQSRAQKYAQSAHAAGDLLPLGHQLLTSSSVYSPEQMPLPIPVPRTLLPAPVERGAVQTGELRHRSARFMQAIAEVIAGVRPARQLSPWMTREVHTELNDYVNRTFHHGSGAQRQRAQVVSVHVFMVNEDAAEVAARMVLCGRSHAIAARLQHVHDPRERSVWRCTSLAWA